MAGHRLSSRAAVFTLNDLAKLIYSDAMSAHFHQCAHYGAHHVAEKAVGSDGKHPLRALLLPSCVSDLAIICFHIGVEFADPGHGASRRSGQAGVFPGGSRLLAGHPVFAAAGPSHPASAPEQFADRRIKKPAPAHHHDGSGGDAA